jgi:hypothetical protein
MPAIGLSSRVPCIVIVHKVHLFPHLDFSLTAQPAFV